MGLALLAVLLGVFYDPSLVKGLFDSASGTPGAPKSAAEENTKASSSSPPPSADRLFTPEELKQYRGDNPKLMIAVLGEVYDVSKGKKFYGKGGGYEFFSGVDGSRAFKTGDFSEKGLVADVSGMSFEDYAGIEQWRKFYEDSKKYTYAGKVIGPFYDGGGQPTETLKRVRHGVAEHEKFLELQKTQEQLFTKCNSNWSQAKGGYVWCADGQYPRKAMLDKPDGGVSERCACLTELQLKQKPKESKETLKRYPGCRKKQKHCQSVRPGQKK